MSGGQVFTSIENLHEILLRTGFILFKILKVNKRTNKKSYLKTKFNADLHQQLEKFQIDLKAKKREF